ncbi:MAG: hypothetical protein JXR51_15035 [Bacteroidales bacterium]|nr:hypothetical protein [Bacteroidales bacterium]MBN2758486.1 hypothetical protein [Bacteroidales bacterium]
MNDKINNELVKIQDELSSLDTAVKQIEKAETVASNVIKTISELQGKYSNHLDFIQKQVSELLAKNEIQSEDRLNQLSESFKKQAEEMSNVFSEYHKTTVSAQNQNNDILKRSLDKTDSQIYQISASHSKQIDEVNGLITKYLDLAQATAELNQDITNIDFPVRLQNLESAAKQLNQVQVELNNDFLSIDTKTDEILKKIKKQNRKSTTIMIFAILIFIAVAGIGLDVLLKYFPDMLSFLK